MNAFDLVIIGFLLVAVVMGFAIAAAPALSHALDRLKRERGL